MTNWYEGDVPSNGINLHYVRSGGEEGNGRPPLVLSHGITDSGLCWTRLARALEETYDIIMVDARGHGDSEKPADGYTSGVHAADLAGLIEALGLADRSPGPRVMGHSMGGATASTLAAHYPQLVSRLVLEDPPWRSDAPGTLSTEERGGQLSTWREEMRERQKQSREEIEAQGRKLNPGWDDAEFEPWSRAKKQVSLDVFSYRLDVPQTWREVVCKIECSTLLITGEVERGAIVTAETAAAVAEENANVEMAHVSGAGHNIRRERFEEFLNVVREFLA